MYLYQGLAPGTYTTQASPRTTEEHEEAVRLNAEFETSGISRGVERYNNELSKDISQFSDTGRSAFADSDVGSKLVDQCMKPLVIGFYEIQSEAQQGFGSKGHNAVWWGPILCLSPEKLAAITIRTVLAGLQPEVAHARKWTACALLIGQNMKQEREFDLWKDRNYREAREQGTINLYKVMIRRVKKIDPRAVRRFMRMSTDIDRLDWTKEVRLHVGMKCLDTLIRFGNGWFECHFAGKGYGRTRHVEKTVRLTEIARRAIEDDHERCELNRPFLLPMLCEPVRWRWDEARTQRSTKSGSQSSEDTEVQEASGAIGQAIQKAQQTQG